MRGKDGKAAAFDDKFSTMMAKGVFCRVPRDIADIHVPDPCLKGDITGFLQCGEGGNGEMGELVQGSKAGKVEGSIGQPIRL